MEPQRAREQMLARLERWDDLLREAYAQGEISSSAAVRTALRIEDLRLSLMGMNEREAPKQAERERDELLWAVDDVQRDPNVALVQSVNHLVQIAGAIRHRLSTARVEKPRDEHEACRRTEKALRDAKESWARIEKLVGREFTSPQSVIDRVAWLVEQAHQRDGVVTELKELRRDHADLFRRTRRAEDERDELMRAARKLLDSWGSLNGDTYAELAEIVQQIETKDL